METAVTAKKITLKGGYLFFIAYLIYTLGFYALYNVNSLNVYYVSYYAHSNPNDGITIRSVYFTTAILGFASAIGVSVSGLLEQKTGIRITLVVATSLGLITSIILFFFTNVPLYLLACLIVGLSEGLCMINSKYLCMFFPGQEGFITANLFLLRLLVDGLFLGKRLLIQTQLSFKMILRFMIKQYQKMYLNFHG